VLDLLLGAEFAGVGVLREQARSVMVTGGCDCGCPTVYLQVSSDVPAGRGESNSTRTVSPAPAPANRGARIHDDKWGQNP
jgi:hypothetical protein